MAAAFSVSGKPLLLLALLSLAALPARSADFAVSGDGTWAIPAAKDAEAYNKWASENRFQVGDTVHFKYRKDSVMVVSEEDYSKCRSTHPIFFSNSGDTRFKFDRPGLFYFISGVDGHCERGERMIIKVMAGPAPPGGQQPEGPSSGGGLVLSASLPLLTLAVGSAAGLAFGI